MEPTIPPSPVRQEIDLAAELRALKSLFYVALLALFVMGVALNLFLGKQMRIAQAQLYAQQKGMDDSERLVQNFAVAMNGFAGTNKDFQPIFDKYRNVFAKYLGGAAPAGPAQP